MKKIFRILFLFVFALVVALLILPFIYKGELVGAVRDAINKNVNAHVDFEDLDVSFIKSFPNVSVKMHKLSIHNDDTFDKMQLMNAESLDMDVDFMSFVKEDKPYKINSVSLTNGSINLVVDENGKFNYEIWKTSDSAIETTYTLELSKYTLKNIDINYLDPRSDTQITSLGTDHSGTGDFTQDVFNLSTNSDIRSLSVLKADFPYLNKLRTKGSLDLKVDNNTSTYTISNNDISLEDLGIKTEGYLQLDGDDINMDLNISSDNENFGDFLSVIPLDIKKDISGLDTKGIATVEAKVKGKYSTNQYPGLNAKIKVEDGYIKNSDFPEPIKNINCNLTIVANDKDWNDMEINLEDLKMNIAGEDIKGRLKYTNLLTDPYYDMELVGNLDLEKIHQILPIENIKSMQGSILSDVAFKGSQSNIENKNYGELEFKMDMNSNGLKIDYEEGNDLVVTNFDINSNPRSLQINSLDGKLGASDYSISGNVENPLAILTSGSEISGAIKHKSNHIDLDELTTSETESTGGEINIDQKIIDNSQLSFTSEVNTIKYLGYQISGFKANGKIAPNNIKIQNSDVVIEGSKVKTSGNLRNAYNHITKNDSLYGDLSISSPSFDMNKFVSEGESEQAEALRIPPLYNINIDLKADKVLYSDTEVKEMNSQLSIKDGIANLKNCKSKAMGGNVNLEGFYNSLPDQPEFSFKYQINKFNFQETFKKLATFRQLAPAAEFIEGFFNSTLLMSGSLKNGFELDYNSLSASGFLETLNSKFSGYAPIMDLADKLGVDKLKQIDLENTKNWFEIADGGVILKAHDYNIDDVKMRVGGKQKFDMGIDYVAQLEIPRDKIKNSSVGKIGNQGIDFLEGEAAKLGVNLDVGDFIYLDVNITGTIKNPKFKIVPKGAGGKSLKDSAKDVVSNVIQDKKNEYTEKANKKIDRVKDSASSVVLNTRDTIIAKAEQRVDKAVQVAKDTLTSKVKSGVVRVVKDTLVTKLDDKVKDVLGDQSGELDKLKDKLKTKIPGFPKKKN